VVNFSRTLCHGVTLNTPPSTESQTSYCGIKYVSIENVTVLTAVMFSDYESAAMRQGKADSGEN